MAFLNAIKFRLFGKFQPPNVRDQNIFQDVSIEGKQMHLNGVFGYQDGLLLLEPNSTKTTFQIATSARTTTQEK